VSASTTFATDQGNNSSRRSASSISNEKTASESNSAETNAARALVRSTTSVEIPCAPLDPGKPTLFERGEISRTSSRNVQQPSDPPYVVFSNSTSVYDTEFYKEFLDSEGVRAIQDVAQCDILCVGHGEKLKRSEKLLTAVIFGKDVVTDNWVSDSLRKGKLLNYKEYAARDPVREASWRTDLSSAIEREKRGTKALEGWAIYFTPNAKANLGKFFGDPKQICVQVLMYCSIG